MRKQKVLFLCTGEHRIVRGADHFSIVTDRRNAETVSEAVEELVMEARHQ